MDEPNVWLFNMPFLYFGNRSLMAIEDIPGKKCFIVTDPGIVKTGLLSVLTNNLTHVGKIYDIFSEVEPDPQETTVLRAAKQCIKYQPDLIIALGGGSSIDTAKGVWMIYEHPDMTLGDMHPFNRLNLGVKAKLLAIPTTSGTGAEATWAAVITRILNDGSQLKLELANKEFIPSFAILDPQFTQNLPLRITISTFFDAITHIIEGILCPWRNDFTEAMAIKGLELIHTYYPKILKDEKNLEYREKLLNASCMAGISFSNSQVIMGHALGHALGAVFHFPHGCCVGVFLRYIIEFILNDSTITKTHADLARICKMVGISRSSDSNDVAIQNLISEIETFQKLGDFPQTLQDLKITKEQFDQKIDQVVEKTLESGSSILSPRPASKEQYKKILQYAFDGKHIDF